MRSIDRISGRLRSLYCTARNLSWRQRRLQHRPGVAHVINLAAESAAAHLRIDALNGVALAVVIDSARVFGVKSARILLPHEFPHDREHIDLTLVEKHLGVFLIRLFDYDVAEMDMVNAIARAEIPRHLYRVFAQFARHPAIEGDAVGWAFNDVHEALPPGQG